MEEWITTEKSTMEHFFEVKWWKITRYECTLVLRDKEWWYEHIDQILHFYKDLINYKKDTTEFAKLKERVIQAKKRKKKTEIKPLEHFQLISSDEEDN